MSDTNRRHLLMGTATALAATSFATTASAQSLVPGPDNWATLNRAQRDSAYNNSAAVADSAKIVDGWTQDSAKLRERFASSVDIPYGPKPRNKWDLFPASDRSAPCLVHIHGGYWQARSRENFSCMLEGILAAGFSAAMPGYTLASDATLTEIVGEVRHALDWLSSEGPSRGIAGPVILSGWSAGGHLCAMALDHPSVRAGLAISGIYELGPLRDTYLNDKLHLTDEEVAALSPLRLAPVNKPLALAYGTGELPPLIENSRTFQAYRASHHEAGSLIPVPRANHFTVYDQLRSQDGVLAQAVVELARSARS
jgi:arylformamidase